MAAYDAGPNPVGAIQADRLPARLALAAALQPADTSQQLPFSLFGQCPTSASPHQGAS